MCAKESRIPSCTLFLEISALNTGYPKAYDNPLSIGLSGKVLLCETDGGKNVRRTYNESRGSEKDTGKLAA